MQWRCIPVLVLAAIMLSGCITTSMQGYADRALPEHPIHRIAALVAAPPELAASLQRSIAEEARQHGVAAQDALVLFPPTRTYRGDEIKRELAKDGIDGVLVLTVGDTGVRKEYAGTIFFGNYSGSSNAFGTATTFGNTTNLSMTGTSNGMMTASAIPNYRFRRETAFKARLLEASTGRVLWVGNGQVKAGGLLFIGNGANAHSTIAPIFDDLQNKGLISPAAS